MFHLNDLSPSLYDVWFNIKGSFPDAEFERLVPIQQFPVSLPIKQAWIGSTSFIVIEWIQL